MIRTFIAIELPENIKSVIVRTQKQFARASLPFKWVKPLSIHLTLKFLGDISESDINGICEAIKQCAANFSPMTFSAKGFGVFPGFKKPRVLWVGMAGDIGPLKKLCASLDQRLEPLGFDREKRPFSAHITLGRARGGAAPNSLIRMIEEVGEFTSPDFKVDQIALFKSDLKPSGAVYTKLASTFLSGATP